MSGMRWATLAAATLAACGAQAFELSSPEVAPGAKIAEQQVFNGFGCKGGNISPALKWSGAPAGTKGISLFLVPKLRQDAQGDFTVPNDVRCVSIEHKLGSHASPTAVLNYGEKDGAVTNSERWSPRRRGVSRVATVWVCPGRTATRKRRRSVCGASADATTQESSQLLPVGNSTP